jgi:hypothetical protein
VGERGIELTISTGHRFIFGRVRFRCAGRHHALDAVEVEAYPVSNVTVYMLVGYLPKKKGIDTRSAMDRL